MIFFPMIYKDELLYSVIARYSIRSGNISVASNLEDLFSNKNTKVNVELPGNINKLIKNLPYNCNYTSYNIIFNTTLYPFYTFFNSYDFSTTIFNLMVESDNNTVLIRAGTRSYSIDSPIYFRFCEKCMEEDIKKYGEYYWHRIHQIPGVFICPTHRSVLYESTIKLKNYNKKEFIAPNKENCIKNKFIKYDMYLEEKLYNLSKDIEFILNTQLQKKDAIWYSNNYINALIKMDLATLNGNIHVRELVAKFKQYYGNEFLNLIQCNISDEGYNNWLLDIFRKPRKKAHPIRHLLVIRFLGYSIKEIVENEIRYRAFGDGPWPCMNKVCKNYKSPVITNINITYYKKEDKFVGEFECVCGFKYTRRGPDSESTSIYEITKIKNYGHIWNKKLEELVNSKSYTLAQMEEILNCDKGTIYRNCKKLNIPIYKRIENKYDDESAPEPPLKINYYENWSNLVLENPDKSKTELRYLDESTYAWLYKNDKEWLDENSPLKHRESKSYSNVDWKKRDEEVLNLIKDSNICNFDSNEKPIQITVSYISRIINRPLMYYLSTNKIPNTKKYLDSITEDTDKFRKRKIKWAINSFIYRNEDPTVYKVKLLLSFSPNVINEYRDYILDLIYGIENEQYIP